ncbi:MAG: phosphate/phosphite/phosphonate ABC transporter substrate-binding protein [Anaerolineae bacterium]
MRTRSLLLCVLLATVVMLSGVVMVSAQAELGSPDNPIQVLFVPSVEAATIVSGGEIMAQALNAATGLTFEVSVPTSYAATIEAMCASPDNTIGFIPAAGYVIAHNRCGVEVEAAAVRNGWPVYWAEYIVRRDAPIYTFGDLEGKTWAGASVTSSSGYVYPASELIAAGITPGEFVESGGHPQTVLAVANGEVDFGATFYSPPITPGAPWAIGDLPEPFDLTVDESYVTDEGLFVGDVQIKDARETVIDTMPDIINQVRVLRLSAPIPNDTISFGPEFPAEMRTQIIDALIAFSGTEEWANSIGSRDFYAWSGLEPTTDAAYEPVRVMMEALGRSEEDILGG